MIDTSWEWTIISLFAIVVGYYAYRKRISDFYDQWKASGPEDKASEELDYDILDKTFEDPLPEDRIFKSTVPLKDQGFIVAPNHPHRNN